MKLHTTSSTVNAHLPVFASQGFLSAKSKDYGWLEENDLILPFFVDKRLIFRRLIFTTAPLSKVGRMIDAAEEKQFLDNIVDYCRSVIKADFVAKPMANAIFGSLPRGSIAARYGTYVVDLGPSEEEIFSGFKSSTRTKIRKTANEGIVFEETSDIETIANLIRETFARSGDSALSPGLNFLQAMQRNLGDSVQFYVTRNSTDIQTCAVVVFDADQAYYYYGGSIDKPATGSAYLMHWETMRRMKRLGIKKYDFMGAAYKPKPDTKSYTLQEFKQRFNPKEISGYTFKVIFRPVKYAVFNMLARTSFMLKGGQYHGDSIDLYIREHGPCEGDS